MIKDLMYTSMGAALLAKERLHEEMDAFEQKSDESKQKAKAFYDKLEKKGRDHEGEFKNELKTMIKEVIEEMDLATKKDLQELKK